MNDLANKKSTASLEEKNRPSDMRQAELWDGSGWSQVSPSVVKRPFLARLIFPLKKFNPPKCKKNIIHKKTRETRRDKLKMMILKVLSRAFVELRTKILKPRLMNVKKPVYDGSSVIDVFIALQGYWKFASMCY